MDVKENLSSLLIPENVKEEDQVGGALNHGRGSSVEVIELQEMRATPTTAAATGGTGEVEVLKEPPNISSSGMRERRKGPEQS